MNSKKVSFVALGLVVVFVIVFLFGRVFMTGEPVFVYNDSFENRVAHIIAYEYLDTEGFVPVDFRVVDKRVLLSDVFNCDFLFDDFMLDENLECTNPLYWKSYAFGSDNSTVLLGYVIFENEVSARGYVDYLLGRLDSVLLLEDVFGGVVESRVLYVPMNPGYLVDDIWLYLIEVEENNLISVVLSNSTVYVVRESSESDFGTRRFTSSFNPESHEGAIDRRGIVFID